MTLSVCVAPSSNATEQHYLRTTHELMQQMQQGHASLTIRDDVRVVLQVENAA